MRVNTAFQFTSHVLPPSAEKACSKRKAVGVIADGIVQQERTGRVPAPVRYSLTAYGQSVLPIADVVRRWGRGHIDRFAIER